jgi:hypothetical protein
MRRGGPGERRPCRRAGRPPPGLPLARCLRPLGCRCRGRRPEPVPEAAVYGPERWREAADRLGETVRRLAAVPADDVAAWRALAADAAGVAAALSRRVEASPGPLARASDLLDRSAQGPRQGHRRATVAAPKTLKAAVVKDAVMAQATLDDDRVALAWQLLLAELLRLVQALHGAYLARSEAEQAARLAGEARSALEEARVRLGSLEAVREELAGLAVASDLIPPKGTRHRTFAEIALGDLSPTTSPIKSAGNCVARV